jgi:hypothetical protein
MTLTTKLRLPHFAGHERAYVLDMANLGMAIAWENAVSETVPDVGLYAYTTLMNLCGVNVWVHQKRVARENPGWQLKGSWPGQGNATTSGASRADVRDMLLDQIQSSLEGTNPSDVAEHRSNMYVRGCRSSKP